MSIEEDIVMFKEGKVELVDTRSFEEYMESHIPESALATFYERRWPDDIASYAKNAGRKLVFLALNPEISEKISSSLRSRGVEPQIYIYKDFLEKGKFKVAHATNLTPDQYLEQRDQWNVIDVRDPYEWATGHIEEAILMPMNDIIAKYETLDKSKRYAIVCEHGNRSMYITMFLSDRGFNVANIDGGMSELRPRGIF
ncbi:MAG: rhodanese-like domain-containing protein [Cuniculiplasma sp.]